MDRVKEFFAGDLAIPTIAWKNPITKQYTYEADRFIKDIPHLSDFLDESNRYLAEYRTPRQVYLL